MMRIINLIDPSVNIASIIAKFPAPVMQNIISTPAAFRESTRWDAPDGLFI
jgi:hypothetical protein